jgi:hypothetical protein
LFHFDGRNNKATILLIHSTNFNCNWSMANQCAAMTAVTVAQFSVGDHLFHWCSFLGVPFAYQEHAIVLAVDCENDFLSILNFDFHEDQNGEVPKQEELEDATKETSARNDDGNGSTECQTARDKESSKGKGSKDSSQTPRCKMVLHKISTKEAQTRWKHVQYSQQWHERLLQRAGTCSDATPDAVPIILCRIKFLQEHEDLLLTDLPYHSHRSNGECLALWCTTGNYRSAAGTAKMGEAGMHVGSFSVVGGVAAQFAVSVMLPVVLPFLVAADVGQAVYSAKEVHATKREWQERTNLWNDQFMEYLQQQYIPQGSVSVTDNSITCELFSHGHSDRKRAFSSPPYHKEVNDHTKNVLEQEDSSN